MVNELRTVEEQGGTKIRVMGDLGLFSRIVLKKPLYGYQLAPARAVLESVRTGRGDEFLLVMSRQSGKNETVSAYSGENDHLFRAMPITQTG